MVRDQNNRGSCFAETASQMIQAELAYKKLRSSGGFIPEPSSVWLSYMTGRSVYQNQDGTYSGGISCDVINSLKYSKSFCTASCFNKSLFSKNESIIDTYYYTIGQGLFRNAPEYADPKTLLPEIPAATLAQVDQMIEENIKEEVKIIEKLNVLEGRSNIYQNLVSNNSMEGVLEMFSFGLYVDDERVANLVKGKAGLKVTQKEIDDLLKKKSSLGLEIPKKIDALLDANRAKIVKLIYEDHKKFKKSLETCIECKGKMGPMTYHGPSIQELYNTFNQAKIEGDYDWTGYMRSKTVFGLLKYLCQKDASSCLFPGEGQTLPAMNCENLPSKDSASLNKLILDHFNSKSYKPLGITYCVNYLIKGSSAGFSTSNHDDGTNSCMDHASVLIGCRKINGKTQVLLQNSWGTDCMEYAPNIKANCNGGKIWLDYDSFKYMISGAYSIQN